jgi:hypothetical protein
MHVAQRNQAGVVELLLKRGADGTKTNTARSMSHGLMRSLTSSVETIPAVDAGSTALDIAHSRADSDPDFAETFAVLRLMCCSGCGAWAYTRPLFGSA